MTFKRVHIRHTFISYKTTVFAKCTVLHFSYSNAPGTKFDLAVKYGQPTAIIYTTFIGLKSPLLFFKFQGHLSYSSGEDFLRVFTKYGHADHLGQMTRTNYINFCSREA